MARRPARMAQDARDGNGQRKGILSPQSAAITAQKQVTTLSYHHRAIRLVTKRTPTAGEPA